MQNSLKLLVYFHHNFYYGHIYFKFNPDKSLTMTFNRPSLDKFDIRDIF